jgi:uncharacterized protein (DUF736 family)
MEKRKNRGALFLNSKKSESDNSPDYIGNLEYKGESIFISGWLQTDRKGNKYISLLCDKDRRQNDSERDDISNFGY